MTVTLNAKLVHDLTIRWLVLELLGELEDINSQLSRFGDVEVNRSNPTSEVVRFARMFVDGKPWPGPQPVKLVSFIHNTFTEMVEADASKRNSIIMPGPIGVN